MIILDTNILSEMLRTVPDATVAQRLRGLSRARTMTTAVCTAEILVGLALMPGGRRRSTLIAMVQALLREEFADRVLAFDRNAAEHYAEIQASRKHAGKPISVGDAQIAAIARYHGATLCTRNVKDFDSCGIPLWNPWVEDVPHYER